VNQSNIIFGAAFVAYVIFITMRGELPIYLGLLLNTQSVPVSGGGGSAQSPTTGNSSLTPQQAQALGSGAYDAAILALGA
jgi:hypothetical protein